MLSRAKLMLKVCLMQKQFHRLEAHGPNNKEAQKNQSLKGSCADGRSYGHYVSCCCCYFLSVEGIYTGEGGAADVVIILFVVINSVLGVVQEGSRGKPLLLCKMRHTEQGYQGRLP